jgi:outer membrane receptor protein involved in Fe transport
MSKLSVLLRNAILSSVVIISFAVTAQEIEEVVVTATKKEESVQDLALSIEAVNAESLDVNQVYDVSDLTEIIPGLETAKGIGSGSGWVMRGMLSYGIGAGVIASVVTSVNGHSVNDSVVADTGFFDLERIEVLKGPQGTLFGRNAVNGVINLVTARPTSEFEGSYDVQIGNFGAIRTNAVLNMPISDNLRTRLALVSNKRDGMVTNIVTGNDYDDRNDLAFRLSVDYDLSDRTQIKFTYSEQESDDSRPQEEVSFCAQDPYYGCNPYVRGGMNIAADNRGHFAGALGFLAHLDTDTISNAFSGQTASDDFTQVALNREPSHFQNVSVANLQIDHDLTDELLLTAKLSYETRDYHQMNDQDLSYATAPFTGTAASLGVAPIEGFLCFGGPRQFCETVDSERIYDFSDVNYHGTQMEVNIISDFDGPFNYTVGLYQVENRNDNEYRAQTAGTQFLTSFSHHPYSAVVQSLTGIDWSSKGGIPFYQSMLTWLGLAPNALSCGAGGPCDLALLGAFSNVTAANNAMPDVVIPWELGGILNDQNVLAKSTALYGEMYFDLSDDTKLTVGARYQDDETKSWTYNDNTGNAWLATGGFLVDNRDTLPFVDVDTVVDDQFSYKIALQHNLADDVMVYGSFTTGVKAGGTNAGDNPTQYDPEKNATLDFGLKSILMDGAMLLNMNVFNTQNDGFLIGQVVNAGTENRNVDAEFTGFEGNMMLFLSETTKLEANWLFLDNEVTSDTMLVDYLNPAGEPISYQVPLQGGLIVAGVTASGAGWFKSAGYNCNRAFIFTSPCAPSEEGVPQNVKGNNLPGSADESYGLSITQDLVGNSGVTSMRLSYRYRGEADLNIFNTERMKIDGYSTMDLLVRYTPNTDDWYVGLYAKNLRDQQHLNYLRESSNVGGGSLLGSFTDPRIYGIEFGAKF